MADEFKFLADTLNEFKREIKNDIGLLFDKFDDLLKSVMEMKNDHNAIERRVEDLEKRHKDCDYLSRETQDAVDFVIRHKGDIQTIVNKHLEHEKTLATAKTEIVKGISSKIVPLIWGAVCILGGGGIAAALIKIIPHVKITP